MACNCEGKTINIGMGCCQPVLAPIENYYTKWEVDELIESATTSGCCITPEEVDEKIEEAISGISVSGVTEEELNNAIASAKTEIEAEIPTVPTSNTAFTNDAGYLTEHQSLSGYATEQWVLDKNYITGVDLSNYATKDEIPTVPTKVSAFENDVPYLTEHQSLSGYVTDVEMSAFTYDKATIDEKVASGGTFDPTQYYNKTQTNELVESAVTRVEAEIPTVPTSNTAFTNDAGYLTEHQSLSGYATEQWVLDKNYITGVDLSNYDTKAEVNSKISEATSGKAETTALTAHTANTNIHVTTTEKNTWNNKQNKLTAGTGINITNNVISATGGTTYTAGRGIDIVNNEISLGLPIWEGTEEDWKKSIKMVDETNVVSGVGSVVIGKSLSAVNNYEVAFGEHNISLSDNSMPSGRTIFTVGNGLGFGSEPNRNAFDIRANGDIYIKKGNNPYDTGERIKLQDHLGGGVTSGEVQTMIDSSLSGYQEELTAGTNVQINNNVISATDTKYTAGDGISISNQNVISTVTKFWCGTQSEYDQILVKDPNTLYLIHN